MERPVMHPQYLADSEPEAAKRVHFRRIKKVFRLFIRVLLAEPFAFGRSGKLKIEDAPPLQRFIRGVFYRLAFVPLMAVLIAVAMVYTSTHPPSIAMKFDPSAIGLFFEQANFTSEDGVNLEGWMIPVIDARTVLDQKEKALKVKRPAIVLVHDFAANREQMLPLIKPFHDAGMVVLVTSLRGNNSFPMSGQTFGLNESKDVLAAVTRLRNEPFVDGKRIGVMGTGSGATAAMLAITRDPTIAAIVLQNPILTSDQIVDRLGLSVPVLHYINPLCKWTFELGYRVDTGDLNPARFMRLSEGRPMLTIRTGQVTTATLTKPTMDAVMRFLDKKLAAPPESKVAGLPMN